MIKLLFKFAVIFYAVIAVTTSSDALATKIPLGAIIGTQWEMVHECQYGTELTRTGKFVPSGEGKADFIGKFHSSRRDDEGKEHFKELTYNAQKQSFRIYKNEKEPYQGPLPSSYDAIDLTFFNEDNVTKLRVEFDGHIRCEDTIATQIGGKYANLLEKPVSAERKPQLATAEAKEKPKVSRTPSGGRYWAGLKAEIEGEEGSWSLVIEYSMDGTSYNASIDYDFRENCIVKGKVSGTGILEKTVCDIGAFERTFSGNVAKMTLEEVGNWGGSDFIDKGISKLRARYFAAAEEADLGRYWAGHKVVLSTETDGDFRDCQLTIKYSNDGLMYSASVEVDSLKAEPGGKCSGKVDKFGNLERKECTPGDWQQRDIVGTVWAPKYDNVMGSSSGGCQWKDQTLLITQKTLIAKLNAVPKKELELKLKEAEAKAKAETVRVKKKVVSKKRGSPALFKIKNANAANKLLQVLRNFVRSKPKVFDTLTIAKLYGPALQEIRKGSFGKKGSKFSELLNLVRVNSQFANYRQQQKQLAKRALQKRKTLALGKIRKGLGEIKAKVMADPFSPNAHRLLALIERYKPLSDKKQATVLEKTVLTLAVSMKALGIQPKFIGKAERKALENTKHKRTAVRKNPKGMKASLQAKQNANAKSSADLQKASDPVFQKGLDAAKRKDYATAIRIWGPLAKQGHGRAQNGIGVLFRNGRGVKKNLKTSVKWFRISASSGSQRGQYNLGSAYRNGMGVRKDPKTAKKWFRLSAKQGYSGAQFQLGAAYQYNWLDTRPHRDNAKKAVKWYTLAAKQGHNHSQYTLGFIYHYGFTGRGSDEIKKDIRLARKWYRLAAKGKDAKSRKSAKKALSKLAPIFQEMDAQKAQKKREKQKQVMTAKSIERRVGKYYANLIKSKPSKRQLIQSCRKPVTKKKDKKMGCFATVKMYSAFYQMYMTSEKMCGNTQGTATVMKEIKGLMSTIDQLHKLSPEEFSYNRIDTRFIRDTAWAIAKITADDELKDVEAFKPNSNPAVAGLLQMSGPGARARAKSQAVQICDMSTSARSVPHILRARNGFNKLLRKAKREKGTINLKRKF